MNILEQNITPKNPAKKSEDGIVVTPDFIAVIDGSTSKATRRYSLFSSNGRLAMQIVARTLRRVPKSISMAQFCLTVTQNIRKRYRHRDLPYLAEHAEERMAASAVVFSRLRREVWMIGDCQCLINGELYENPKPYEQQLAEMRAAEVRRLMSAGTTIDQLRHEDTARPTIIPHMLNAMKQQNVGYSVFDGFPIPLVHVRLLPLTFDPFEIVLASDGYPFLHPTLAASEAALQQQIANDPLNIGQFKATKGCLAGNNSFDDRAYIRFTV